MWGWFVSSKWIKLRETSYTSDCRCRASSLLNRSCDASNMHKERWSVKLMFSVSFISAAASFILHDKSFSEMRTAVEKASYGLVRTCQQINRRCPWPHIILKHFDVIFLSENNLHLCFLIVARSPRDSKFLLACTLMWCQVPYISWYVLPSSGVVVQLLFPLLPTPQANPSDKGQIQQILLANGDKTGWYLVRGKSMTSRRKQYYTISV